MSRSQSRTTPARSSAENPYDSPGTTIDRIWAGIDAGKGHHLCFVIEGGGTKLSSRRVADDEPDLLQLITDVLPLGDEVVWAIDLADDRAALVNALLLDHDQQVLCIPGRTVNRAMADYRGEDKTDARDAHVIADQAHMPVICSRSGPARKPPSSSVCSPAAVPTRSATALEPSTAYVTS